jgi:hypothetical protein
MTAPDHPGKVCHSEISDLISWLRRLSDTGAGRVDPAELAAFHAAKADLITRIETEHQQPGIGSPAEEDQ